MSSKRRRPTLSPEEDARRLELWRQGLTDREIGAACGTVRQGICGWRRVRGLQANTGPQATNCAVPMRQALPPEGCELVSSFFGALLALRDRHPEHRIDVTAALKAWRSGLLRRGETA